jgi:hypothetical protein
MVYSEGVENFGSLCGWRGCLAGEKTKLDREAEESTPTRINVFPCGGTNWAQAAIS